MKLCESPVYVVVNTSCCYEYSGTSDFIGLLTYNSSDQIVASNAIYRSSTGMFSMKCRQNSDNICMMEAASIIFFYPRDNHVPLYPIMEHYSAMISLTSFFLAGVELG